ncbi:nucleotide exchange factor GrpE [Candidatus Falkowbacteria bacterium RIFCSPLOWO2_12_FULL_45_13]|uniref:Protein GrpE n=2 Tax=Candidatus Falkowiibacteriota TaxID=1752728 RepID=A0A1F5SAP5_9BACT|nr:MAG: nucleotide exchange factor GrpE [Candidatus Falkowbacteria bacterium RIFCSPLOWO2_02_FULL_45_21]OGF32075.1 MAG: nucleotide exchange factor GrpE [Candidatus Falkowbacteria bacterium RIFCSPLOWO2_12_FULL_45_13]
MAEEKNMEQEKQAAGSGRGFPEVVVAAVIYNDQGEILLTQCAKWGDCWQIPGGHVEPGETCGQALKREIREETGLEIDNIKLNDLQDCIYPKDFSRKAHFVFLDYSARLAGGKMAEKNREMEDFKWIKPEQALKELKLNPYTKISVEKFIENRKHDYESLYKRALADYQNLVKQTAKEKMEFARFANELMLKEILPVYGHLKMALEHANGTPPRQSLGQSNNASSAELGAGKEITEGVRHVVKQFKDVLEKIGVTEIKTAGEKFDHNSMEAVGSEEIDDKNLDGQVARQLKAGYTLNGKMIEAAKVVVYKMKS